MTSPRMLNMLVIHQANQYLSFSSTPLSPKGHVSVYYDIQRHIKGIWEESCVHLERREL